MLSDFEFEILIEIRNSLRQLLGKDVVTGKEKDDGKD